MNSSIKMHMKLTLCIIYLKSFKNHYMILALFLKNVGCIVAKALGSEIH